MTRNALEASEGTGEAAKAFEQMGVEVTDANDQLRPAFDMLLDLSDSLGGLASDSEAAAQAQRLFGRAGAELLPLLKEGRDGIGALQKQARALGLEFSTKSADDAAAFEDAMTNLSGAWTAGSQALAIELLPKFTEWINKLASGMVFMTGFSKTLRASFAQWVSGAEATFDQISVAWNNWNRTTEEMAKTAAGALFEPIALAGRIIWEPIRYAAGITWNEIGEDVTGLANSLIDQFNSFGEAVGLTIDNVDFSPMTVEAPRTLAEQWDQSQRNIDDALTKIGQLNNKAAEDWEKDWAEVGKGWDLNLIDMWKDAGIAGDKAMANYLRNAKATLDADGDTDLVAPSRELGDKAGTAMIDGMGGVFVEGFEDLLLRQDTIGALEGVGAGIGGLMITGMSEHLGEKAAGHLTPFETYGEDAGDAMTAKIGERVKTFFSLVKGPWNEVSASPFGQFMAGIVPDLPANFGEDIGTKLGTGIGAGLTAYFGLHTLDQLTGGHLPDELIVGISIADAVMSATGTSMGDLATAAQSLGGTFNSNFLTPIQNGLISFFHGQDSGLRNLLPNALFEGKGAEIGGVLAASMSGALAGAGIGSVLGNEFAADGAVIGAIAPHLEKTGALGAFMTSGWGALGLAPCVRLVVA